MSMPRALTGIGRRGKFPCVAAALVLVTACGESAAQVDVENYPDRPITWVVAFEPGGGSDAEFRRLQPYLEETLGVTINVEYREGADGGVGWAELANAQPDGYTVGGIVMPHIALQPMVQDEGGFTTDDFAYISSNVESPQALVVSADDPSFADFEEFAEAAEANPGEISIGASARLNLSHVIATELAQEGLETNYVSAGEGATAVITGVAGDHFEIAMMGANHAVTSDEVEPIAISGEERLEALPDAPTFQELGYDVVGSTSWGVAAPRDTPMEIREILSDAVLEATAEQEVQDAVDEEGLDSLGYGPEETEEFVESTADEYAEIVELIDEEE